MNQEEAHKLYSEEKAIIEQQREEEKNLAKQFCLERQEQYTNQQREAKTNQEIYELENKIRDAEDYKNNKLIEIDNRAAERLQGVDEQLKANVEQDKHNQDKLMEDKARQDAELRQKELNSQEHQQQRDDLDRTQQAEQEKIRNEQKSTDEQLKENLYEQHKAYQVELEQRKQELERQRELSRTH